MGNSKLLSSLQKGERAVVKGYLLDELANRVCDLGLLPGTMVEVTHRIPFDGPMCVCLDKNRCRLAIGEKEASCVLIEKLK